MVRLMDTDLMAFTIGRATLAAMTVTVPLPRAVRSPSWSMDAAPSAVEHDHVNPVSVTLSGSRDAV